MALQNEGLWVVMLVLCKLLEWDVEVYLCNLVCLLCRRTTVIWLIEKTKTSTGAETICLAVTLSLFYIFSIISAEINHLRACVCVYVCVCVVLGLSTPSGLVSDTDASTKLARFDDLSLPLHPDLFLFFFSLTLNLFYRSPAVASFSFLLSGFLGTLQKRLRLGSIHQIALRCFPVETISFFYCAASVMMSEMSLRLRRLCRINLVNCSWRSNEMSTRGIRM